MSGATNRRRLLLKVAVLAVFLAGVGGYFLYGSHDTEHSRWPLRSLATGFLFGPWVGGSVVIVSATAGATLAFLGARYLLAEAVQRRLGARGAIIVSGFAANGFRYLLFLRLVPLFPFWLVNLAPGVTPFALGPSSRPPRWASRRRVSS